MISSMRRFSRRLHDDTQGAMSVEKILILAIIALPIIIVMLLFRDKLITWFNGESGKLNTDDTGGNGGGNAAGGAAVP